MLTHSGKDDAEEPTVTASGASLKENKVVLFALNGAFGTRACLLVALPERTLPGDERMQAIVLLWVGIDDAAKGESEQPLAKCGQVVLSGVFLATAKGQRHLMRRRSAQKPQRFIGFPAGQMGTPSSRRKGPA